MVVSLVIFAKFIFIVHGAYARLLVIVNDSPSGSLLRDLFSKLDPGPKRPALYFSENISYSSSARTKALALCSASSIPDLCLSCSSSLNFEENHSLCVRAWSSTLSLRFEIWAFDLFKAAYVAAERFAKALH